jgi:putative phage-type endonuclease
MPGPCRLLLPETASIPEWLHARVKGIGGSEVAALMGVSPYATSWDVFKSKIDENGEPAFLGEEPVPGPKIRAELLTDNPIFEWGHRLEDAVGLKVADELGLIGRSGGGLWQHIDHPLALVTPDRIGTKRRSFKPECLIECKTSAESYPWEVDEAPIQYQIQAQWQMGITGITPCYLGCFILDFDRNFYIVRVDYDHEWFMELVKVAEEFWERNVLTGEPPEHDWTHPRTEEILKEAHPHVIFEAVQLPEDETEERWKAYTRAKQVVDTATEHLNEAKNWFRFHLGDAGAGYLGDEKVVGYPEVNTRKLSAGKIRELHPEVVEDCTVTSSHRRMNVRPYKRVGK